MQLRTTLRVVFLSLCLAAAALILPARAAEPHEHIAGAVWYPDDPDQHWQTCTLCGRSRPDTGVLIVFPNGPSICSHCVDNMRDMIGY